MALRHQTALSDVLYVYSLSYLSDQATGCLRPVALLMVSITMMLASRPVLLQLLSALSAVCEFQQLPNSARAQAVLYKNPHESTLVAALRASRMWLI